MTVIHLPELTWRFWARYYARQLWHIGFHLDHASRENILISKRPCGFCAAERYRRRLQELE